MIHLWGFRLSVYVRIVRMALAERGLEYDWTEVNPFEPSEPNPHPFGRVPVFDHDGMRLYETSAITLYIDRAFPGPTWQPDDPVKEARVQQVIDMINSYGYWPMVRQVFAKGAYPLAVGEPVETQEVSAGLAASRPLLAELETLAASGTVLSGPLTRADLHLAPMVDYFTALPEAAAMLAEHPALATRFAELQQRPSFTATAPGLPTG
ncbi:glutathione S-transferase family protein [Pseudooceanicola sp. C21-150M6]|uniref:glutathione S-transferase family protein n=1 Tax=Pseudooceanicola sp. C21-150M6 TaxID=3434355 RepID=UPI003D7F7650